MDALSAGLGMALSIDAVTAVFIGSMLGLFFGSIPGLTYSIALALALPVTFNMDPVPAMALLIGTYIGGMTGGSVSAILVGIPGTPSAAATAMDGHALTRQGHAAKALGMAVMCSTFGGLFSLLVMMTLVDWVSGYAISFGPVEIFALVLFGLSTVCGLAGGSMIKGLIGGVLGLMLMTIGLDQIEGTPRMTFGMPAFMQGFDLLIAMIGLFAIPQVMNVFFDHRRGHVPTIATSKVSIRLPSIRDFMQRFWLMVRCSILGTGVGAIPGSGGPIAAFIAYDHARRFERRAPECGKGNMSGVVAPETANNAVTGGTMIPLLSLGIPGDPATAILLVGLMIHSLSPGPMLFVENAPAVYGIYVSFVLAYVAVLAIQLVGIRYFVRLLSVQPYILAVGIMVMCGIGAFAIRNSIFDVYLMAAVGLAGYVLQRVGVPVTPIVLGLVLGKALEGEFRMAMMHSGDDFSTFLSSPVGLVFFGLTALTIGVTAFGAIRSKHKGRVEAGPEEGLEGHSKATKPS